MNSVRATIVAGVVLILAGILFMLQSLGILPSAEAYFWAAAFGGGGIVFLYVFATDMATRWWAIIPGFTLLGLGVIIALSEALPNAGPLTGGIFLGAVAASFWAIYLLKREYWWAVIPGGVLLTLAVVAALGSVAGEITGGIFFVGLGLTFAVLAFLPGRRAQMKWALIPAAVLVFIGLIIAAATAEVLGYVWPLALVGVGIYFILRTLVWRRPA